MTEKDIYTYCKTFSTACSLCLAKNEQSASDMFLDAIYDTLRGKDTSQQFIAAQMLLAVDNFGYFEATEDTDNIQESELFADFGNWLAEQLDTFTLPLNEFIGIMRFAVDYLDAHPDIELLELNDLVNEGFGDAVLIDESVSFTTFKENLAAVYNLIKSK